MWKNWINRRILLTGLLIAALAGAAILFFWYLGSEAKAQPLTPVHGKVYYRGELLHGGTIVFVPDDQRGNRGPLAKADILSDGSFTLRTGEEIGAVPGWHRITVSYIDPNSAGGPGYAAPRSLVPEKYRDPDLSGLTKEILPGKTNKFDIYLD